MLNSDSVCDICGHYLVWHKYPCKNNLPAVYESFQDLRIEVTIDELLTIQFPIIDFVEK